MAKTTAQGPTQPTLQGPLIVNGTHNWAALTSFINKHAGGNTHNVKIVALNNVAAAPLQPVPFGYNGKPNGVRAQIQNHMLAGPTLFAALNAGAKRTANRRRAHARRYPPISAKRPGHRRWSPLPGVTAASGHPPAPGTSPDRPVTATSQPGPLARSSPLDLMNPSRPALSWP